MYICCVVLTARIVGLTTTCLLVTRALADASRTSPCPKNQTNAPGCLHSLRLPFKGAGAQLPDYIARRIMFEGGQLGRQDPEPLPVT